MQFWLCTKAESSVPCVQEGLNMNLVLCSRTNPISPALSQPQLVQAACSFSWLFKYPNVFSLFFPPSICIGKGSYQ